MLVGLFQAHRFAKTTFRVCFQDANPRNVYDKYLSVPLTKIANIFPLRDWYVSMSMIPFTCRLYVQRRLRQGS